MQTHPSTDRLDRQQLAALADLAAVRGSFAEWVSQWVAAERVSDLEVVVSELAANAVQGRPEGAPPATLEARVVEERLLIEVRNAVDGPLSLHADWDMEDPLRTGGRGLLLVSALTDEVTVEVHGGELIVRCRVDLVD